VAYLTNSGATRRTVRTTSTTEREFDEEGRMVREVVTEETVEEEEPAQYSVQWSPTYAPYVDPAPSYPSYPTSPFWWTVGGSTTICNAGESAA
jgi:hypothetical protein